MDNDKLKKACKGKSRKDLEKSFSLAMDILMAIEFAFTCGVYIALKSYASQFLAECWIVFAYAYVLKSNFNSMIEKCKDSVISKFEYEQKKENTVNEEERKQEDIDSNYVKHKVVCTKRVQSVRQEFYRLSSNRKRI